MLPPAVAGIALLAASGRRAARRAARGRGPAAHAATAGVVVALTFVAAPFYLRQAIAAFEAVDPTLLDASRTLGASPARTFARVAVPTALPGLVAGHGARARPRAGRVRRDADVRRLVPGHHADGAARDLRPLRDRLHRGARAVGGAGRGLGGDPAGGQARARARTRSRGERGSRSRRARRSARSRSTSALAVGAGRVPRARRAVGRGQDERAADRRRAAARRTRGRVACGERGLARHRARRRRARRAAALRLRVPGVRAVRPPERVAQRRLRAARVAARASASRARARCSSASASPSAPTRARRRCRAASASASRSPARSRGGRTRCCSTSRSRRSTRARARRPARELAA